MDTHLHHYEKLMTEFMKLGDYSTALNLAFDAITYANLTIERLQQVSHTYNPTTVNITRNTEFANLYATTNQV